MQLHRTFFSSGNSQRSVTIQTQYHPSHVKRSICLLQQLEKLHLGVGKLCPYVAVCFVTAGTTIAAEEVILVTGIYNHEVRLAPRSSVNETNRTLPRPWIGPESNVWMGTLTLTFHPCHLTSGEKRSGGLKHRHIIANKDGFPLSRRCPSIQKTKG